MSSHEHSLGFAYRPALDGLRAVAVCAVLVYHLGYRWFPGGFLGVDIFFVLSGYLITNLLLAEQERTGRISLSAFWLRRAKRLLPALLLVLVAVALWIGRYAPPYELWLRRRDILWTLFYAANWHFIATGEDYFAQFASASPLRHAWSLAIEEQFYLVWPLIVAGVAILTARHRKTMMMICGVGITMSVLAAAWLFDPGAPTRAYFGTDARIYEPLIGGLLAVASRGGVPARLRGSGPLVAALGASALVAGFFLLTDRNAAYYYGVSLVLAASAAMTIWGVETAPNAPIADVLSWGPVRWVGQLSYGLYLWHWPVILAVTAPLTFLAWLPGTTGLNLTRVLATVAISTASFYWFEQPLRQGRVPWMGASGPRFATAAVAAVAAVAAIGVRATVVPPEAAVPLIEIPGCAMTGEPCLRHQGPSGAPVVALIGDSIARSLDPGFSELASEQGWTYVLAAANGCRISGLLTTSEGQPRPVDRDCQKNNPVRWQRLLDDWNPTAIVAIDRWEITEAMGPNGESVAGGTPVHLAMTEESLLDVTRLLTSRGARLAFIELPPVIPVLCSPAAKWSAPECRLAPGDDLLQRPYNEVFRRVARSVPGAATISLTDKLCPTGTCMWTINGRVLRADGIHFTLETSRGLATTLLRQLSAAGTIPLSGPASRPVSRVGTTYENPPHPPAP